jgi:hypothetical protein
MALTRCGRIPGPNDHPPLGVDHDGAHPVTAFDPVAARHLHPERIERRDFVQCRHL